MIVDHAFSEIQRMIVSSHTWAVRECVKTVCKNFTAQDKKILLEKLAVWEEWLLREHDKRSNERYEEACFSVRTGGVVDSAFSDFRSEQNDNTFRGLAKERARLEENIEAGKKELQNLKQEPDVSAE